MRLEIVSRNPEVMRSLKQFSLDGIATIGVERNEPFSIRFKNSLGERIQVRLSIDGTDIIIGKEADLNPKTKMWLVNPHGELELKAWPEDHHGGGSFVFTTAANSVAAHTHGDMSAKGYISAAVFVEGSPRPRPRPPFTHFEDGFRTLGAPTRGEHTFKGIDDEGLESLDGPGVGAGDHVEQRIHEVPGLTKPEFSQIIQVRYLWWDEMVARMKAVGLTPETAEQIQHPTGFKNTEGIDLGTTPRVPVGGETTLAEVSATATRY